MVVHIAHGSFSRGYASNGLGTYNVKTAAATLAASRTTCCGRFNVVYHVSVHIIRYLVSYSLFGSRQQGHD